MSTREKILEAADELFGKQGFDATPTREIAEACGVNRALIHYHFQSKDGLLEAVLDRYYEKLAATIEGTLLSDGDIRERIYRLVDVYVNFLGENLGFSRIVQREASGGRHVDLISRRMVPLLHGLYPTTRQGEMAAQQMLVSIYGMVVSYFTYSRVLEHLLEGDPLADEALAMRKLHICRVIDAMLDAVEGAS